LAKGGSRVHVDSKNGASLGVWEIAREKALLTNGKRRRNVDLLAHQGGGGQEEEYGKKK